MNLQKLWITTEKPIKTDEQYQEVLGMIEKLERWINDRWLEDNPVVKRWVKMHEVLSGKLLDYDVEEDKLPF